MKNILIVDDSAFMRKWLKESLQATNNYQVSAEASNGKEALVQYQHSNPDAVIMDLMMDDMDGLKTLKFMLQLYPNAKVFIYSSLSPAYQVDECLKLGAVAFIKKPDIIDLIRYLDNYFY